MNSPRLKSIVKLFESCRYSHDLYTVFGDWCECSAISMSNAVDLVNFEKREARYLEIARKYGRETMGTFSHIMGEVVIALEERPQDILGAAFHALELHNKARGQFFTPYSICQLMARTVAGSAEDMRKAIAERGFLIAQEPAVGSGTMVIALSDAILEAGFNYQQFLHVTAVDIDPRASHMAYIQFSLLHIPATVIVGDSLAMRFREDWHTLAHVMGSWSAKLGTAGKSAGEGAIALSPAMPPRAAAVATNSSAPEQEPLAPPIEKNGQLRLF
ncbi:N-6 DNA methylase [Rhizobium anhuiense]|uniref:N-6 DNA methylase n=1 Tax=Rhizobium anhuiense TaxID=1184720 RepID=UPI00117B8AB5|nr:N-6 DNA methylase [Rhizobium anhuiense]